MAAGHFVADGLLQHKRDVVSSSPHRCISGACARQAVGKRPVTGRSIGRSNLTQCVQWLCCGCEPWSRATAVSGDCSYIVRVRADVFLSCNTSVLATDAFLKCAIWGVAWQCTYCTGSTRHAAVLPQLTSSCPYNLPYKVTWRFVVFRAFGCALRATCQGETAWLLLTCLCNTDLPLRHPIVVS